MVDLATVGFTIDTTKLKSAGGDIDDIAAKFKQGKISVDEFGDALNKLSVTQQIETLQKLGYSAEEAAAKVKEATEAISQQGIHAEGAADAHDNLAKHVSESAKSFKE